jgi:hypothetical protein
MPDTLVDHPPPTLRDEEIPRRRPPPSASPARRAPQPRRAARSPSRSRSSPRSLLVASVAFYLFVWRYEPVARKHIPGNANLVMRFEFADIALFGPVREHFWPLLFEPRDEPVKGKTRADRVKEATGVNLATDVRELFIATADTTSWVLILGGKLARAATSRASRASRRRTRGSAGAWRASSSSAPAAWPSPRPTTAR